MATALSLLSVTAFGGLPAKKATPTLLAASASGGLLVMATGGLMGARLMLAPAGTRLPPGVHAVLAVPATAAPGAAASGRRRAMRVAAGAAGSEPGYTADEHLERKNDVIRSWELTERTYRAGAYWGNVDQFGKSASMGIELLRDLLDKGKGYSADDMAVLSYSGQCFHRLALQVKEGYVQEATVVEAMQAMQFVCHNLGISSPAPADPSVDVPYDPEVHFMELSDALKEFIDGVTRAAGASGSEPGYTADEDSFNKFVTAKAYQALGLLALLSPPEHLLAEAVKIEEQLYAVVEQQAGEPEAEDKVRPVLSLIGAAYAIVDISKGCFPNTGAPPPFLIEVRPTSSPLEGSPSIKLKDGSVLPLDFGPSMDEYGKMVRSINIAMALATAVTTYIATYRALE